MHMSSKKQWLGTACILIATLCWGFSGVSGQFLMHNMNLPKPVILCIRQIGAGLALILLDHILRRRSKTTTYTSIWKSKKDCRTLAVFAILGICVCQFTFFTSIYYSDAGTATVLQYLSTVIILLVTCIRKKRLPEGMELLAIFLAISGTFLISTGGSFTHLKLSGHALVSGLLCAVSYSTYTLIPGDLVRTYGAKYIVGRGMLLSGSFLCVFVRPWTYDLSITPEILLGFCGLILVGTAAGSTFYHFGASLVEPVKAGILANFDPVSSVLLTVLLLGTTFSVTDLIGFALIISTVFLIHIHQTKQA